MNDARMTRGDLEKVHDDYTRFQPEWKLLISAYEGTSELLRQGYLLRNERESYANYQRRVREAYGFNYSQSVVDILNFYLFKKPAKRQLGPLKDDASWNKFMLNCNLQEDDLDSFLLEQSRYASIYGMAGILVDKSNVHFSSVAEELEAGVYPYLSAFHPTAILDWRYRRNRFGIPELAYLKLLDEDMNYRIWTPAYWEVWKMNDKNGQIELLNAGDNPLGTIPFVWLYSKKGRRRPIGISDIKEIARIDLSIMKNLSNGEEVIDYAAFPMMRKPKQEASPGHSINQEDEVGVTAVLEFDPTMPDSKPDWLEASVDAPINAILSWIERKVAEVYRATNIGGMAATEIQTQAKSGAALQSEFQMLNSVLARKAKFLEKAEYSIIRLWLMWQNQLDYLDEIHIERERTYDVQNLAKDLDNAIVATTLIKSPKFHSAVKKAIVRTILPTLSENEIADIYKEIESQPVNLTAPEIPNEEV